MPQVLLLMSTALNITVPEPPTELQEALSTELRARQQCIAEVTEMIHVSCIILNDFVAIALFYYMLHIIGKISFLMY